MLNVKSTVYPDNYLGYNDTVAGYNHWMNNIVFSKKQEQETPRDISIKRPLGFFYVDKPLYISNNVLFNRFFKFLISFL